MEKEEEKFLKGEEDWCCYIILPLGLKDVLAHRWDRKRSHVRHRDNDSWARARKSQLGFEPHVSCFPGRWS